MIAVALIELHHAQGHDPAVLVASGARLAPSITFPGGVLFLMLLLHSYYSAMRPSPLLATLLGSLAITIIGLCSVGVIALASLQLRMPLIDTLLVRADHALGFDAASVSKFLSQDGTIVNLLTIAYQASIPLIFATLIGQCLISNYDEAWCFSLNIIATAFICSLIALIAPAIGAFATLGVSSDVIARLPLAGNYHLPAFRIFYSAEPSVIDVTQLQGVITFPSFHTAMAVLTAYAWRRTNCIAQISWAWAVVVVFSTIPIGGHYLIDLLGGLILSFFVVCVTKHIYASDGLIKSEFPAISGDRVPTIQSRK